MGSLRIQRRRNQVKEETPTITLLWKEETVAKRTSTLVRWGRGSDNRLGDRRLEATAPSEVRV
jgi:hypothetical protein